MLNGHAYSRGVRAHILTNLILAGIILDEVDLTGKERAETENKLRESERSLILFVKENRTYQSLRAKFKTALHNLEGNQSCGTNIFTRLIQHNYSSRQSVRVIKNLHLYTIDKLLPCFHSVGHYFFTKSVHLYLQDMMALEQRMDPTEFKIFIEQNFTIRRSDKFWPGLWSDLIADVVYEKLLWIGTCAWNLQQ
jgi:hypothetical protein